MKNRNLLLDEIIIGKLYSGLCKKLLRKRYLNDNRVFIY